MSWAAALVVEAEADLVGKESAGGGDPGAVALEGDEFGVEELREVGPKPSAGRRRWFAVGRGLI